MNPRGGSLYLGVNAGTYYIERRTDFSVVSAVTDNWHFGLAPEIGVAIPVRPALAAVLSTRYNYAFASGNVDDQAYVSFGLGLAWSHGYGY